jgi:dimethylamine monooxygenase subunit A
MRTQSDALDWKRILPDADHRWAMGLRPGDAAKFFAEWDSTGAVCAERADWLAQDACAYSAMLPAAEPALYETVQWARSLGAKIDSSQPAIEQLLALGRIWEPDFVWMHPDGHGTHTLIGGVVCFPSSWALRDQLGRPMWQVHEPVPGLNDILSQNIEIFLTRQQPGAAWLRDNVNYSRDAELNHIPTRQRCPLDATVTAKEFFVRLEHQLLLKLPLTGSILFGIRVNVVPFTALQHNHDACTRLARQLATMSSAAAAYKGVASARKTLLELLDRSLAEGPSGER